MSRIDYGQVDIDLGGEVYTLKPTPAAILKINRQFGGLRSAMERVRDIDVDAVAVIVAAGAGLGGREAKDMPERIAAEGVASLAGPVSEYLAYLLNPSGREGSEGEGKD